MPKMIAAIHGKPSKKRRMKKKGRVAEADFKNITRPKTLEELTALVYQLCDVVGVEHAD